MHIRKFKFLAGLYLVMLFCITNSTGCGYRIEKTGHIFPEVPLVYVPVFENDTTYTYAGGVFSNALIQEILAKTNSKITQAPNISCRINAIIKKIEFLPVVRDRDETILQQKVIAWADISLVDMQGKTLWRARGITAKENYTLPPGNLIKPTGIPAEENQIKRAIHSIAERIAEKSVKAMRNNF